MAMKRSFQQLKEENIHTCIYKHICTYINIQVYNIHIFEGQDNQHRLNLEECLF